MPTDFSIAVPVGNIEGKRCERTEPAHTQTGAVFQRHVFEIGGDIAHIVEHRAGKGARKRQLVFQAAYKDGTLGQNLSVLTCKSDAVEFVTAYGGRAAAAEHQP